MKPPEQEGVTRGFRRSKGASDMAARSLSALCLIPLKPVVHANPLPKDTWQPWDLDYSSSSSPGFPRHPFISQPSRKDEQLGRLC